MRKKYYINYGTSFMDNKTITIRAKTALKAMQKARKKYGIKYSEIFNIVTKDEMKAANKVMEEAEKELHEKMERFKELGKKYEEYKRLF